MGIEIDLLKNYPKTKRDVKERGAEKTEEDRVVARQFGKDFFDGDRRHGYGGFSYNPRFWEPVVPTFQQYYNLTPESSILDVGCAKGYMLYDFTSCLQKNKLNKSHGFVAAQHTFVLNRVFFGSNREIFCMAINRYP